MKPLLPAESIPPKWSTWAAGVMKVTGITDMPKLRQLYESEFLRGETWMNDLYVVIHTKYRNGIEHLSIRRADRGAAKDWRHFQQIKNQLCGKEREACELYPAESRLVDTANQYHMWVLPEGLKFTYDGVPIGYDEGRHVYSHEEHAIPGAVQRPFESEAT